MRKNKTQTDDNNNDTENRMCSFPKDLLKTVKTWIVSEKWCGSWGVGVRVR